MARFEGLTVIVTGATGGFGKRAAERFHDEGANLVLSDLAADPGDAFAALDPARHVYEGGDIAREETSARLVALAQDRFGGPDIAFNNAGIAQGFTPLPAIDSDLAQRIVDIDLMGVFYAMKHQIPAMLARGGGSIIFTSTFVGYTVGFPGMAAYAAGKAGLVGLAKVLAAEYGAEGIRVNAILPGGTDTPMGNAVANTPEVRSYVESLHAVKRIAEPEEIAASVLHLASDASRFITGTAMLVDGGCSISRP